MWIKRKAEGLLTRLGAQFPAVLVTGARQTGKTSLLRRLFPDASYLTLDYPGFAEAARTAAESLLDRFPPPVILDEIQYAPELLRHLKARIDRDRKPGQYLLTGSQTFPLMAGVSESLAGRCGVLALPTLSQAEILASGVGVDEEEAVFRGGYPELWSGAEAALWFPSYVATYLERDVRNVLRVADLGEFHRFLRVCALRSGQILNVTDMARDAGIAPNTARKWLGLLEASGVVARLEPYFANRTKRLVKSPKVYFMDTGLAAFLAGFASPQALFASSHAGPFWETFIFGQVLRWAVGRGSSLPLHTWRTVNGHEVDLIIETGVGRTVAVECKTAQHLGGVEPAGISRFRSQEGGRLEAAFVVCRTLSEYRLGSGTWVVDLPGLLRHLDALVPHEPVGRAPHPKR